MKRLITLAALTVVLAGCNQHDPSVHAVTRQVHVSDPIELSQPEIARLGVSVEAAQIRRLPVELDVAGVVQADETMTLPILSLVPGRVDKVYVRLGDVVKKGTNLASIRSDEVAQLESDLLEKDLEFEAEEKQIQMEVDLSRKVLERHKVLFGDKISARADLERAENDYQKSVAALAANNEKKAAAIESTNQRLRLFGIEPTETQRLLKTRVVDQTFDVRSPRYGVITVRDIDAGQAIDESKPLMVVSDLSKVWVVAHVFESDVRSVRRGMPVTAEVGAYPGTRFKGTLEYLASAMDGDTRSLAVRATVSNPQLLLKPDMFARLKLLVGETQALTIPKTAMQKLGEADICYVEAAPGKYQERKVVIGDAIGKFVTIKSGLSAGERVVTNGSVRLLGKIIQRQTQ